MSDDLESLRAQFDEFGDLGGEEACRLLRSILAALHRLGITEVEVGYSGSGDEGAIESSSFLPEAVEVRDELRELVEDWACAVLPEDWEINEGGQGTISIDVASSRARIDHEQNVVTTESETYEIG